MAPAAHNRAQKARRPRAIVSNLCNDNPTIAPSGYSPFVVNGSSHFVPGKVKAMKKIENLLQNDARRGYV
jgi:hypothetical protein